MTYANTSSSLASATASELDRLSAIIDTQQAIANAKNDLVMVNTLVTERTRLLTGADGAVIEMAEGEEMVYRYASGTTAANLGLRLRIESSISGLCVRTGEILRCDDSELDPRVDREACRKVGCRSLIVVPLNHQGTLVGVLKVMSAAPQAFSDQDVHTLRMMAGFIATAMNLAAETEHKQALLREVSEQKDFLERIIDHIPISLAYIDKDLVYRRNNALHSQTLGLPTDQIINRSVFEIFPSVKAHQEPIFRQVLESGQPLQLSSWTTLFKRNGVEQTTYWSVSYVPTFDAAGKANGFISMAADMTPHVENERLHAKVRKMAYYDSLTGLPNRVLFYDRLKQALAYAARQKQQVAVMFLDLDKFKQINDTLGHEAGDEVLKAVAERLSRSTREYDTVARLAGDEFTVILSDVADVQVAAGLAERMLADLKQPLIVKGQELHLSGSFGISLFPRDGREMDTLIRKADAAMYRAKQQRGSYWIHDPASPDA